VAAWTEPLKFGEHLDLVHQTHNPDKITRLQHQELPSKALFFANEAYMTAIAAEQVVLNQQIGLELNLPTAQYPASIAEQTAFIGEQIEHYENNFGRALWKTAKYADRLLTAIDTIHQQTDELVPNQEIIERSEALEPLVETLLFGIKKNKKLNDGQKDEAAAQLAAENPSMLGSNPSEWGRLMLDLQIDVKLQVQEYLLNQQPQIEGDNTNLPVIEGTSVE
jgi:hypothetical protein